MFKINNTSLEITAGDTAVFYVEMDDRLPKEGEKFILTVRDKIGGSPLVVKEIGANECFIFEKEDTSELDGFYYYDIVFIDLFDNRYSVVNPSLFNVKKGVYNA